MAMNKAKKGGEREGVREEIVKEVGGGIFYLIDGSAPTKVVMLHHFRVDRLEHYFSFKKMLVICTAIRAYILLPQLRQDACIQPSLFFRIEDFPTLYCRFCENKFSWGRSLNSRTAAIAVSTTACVDELFQCRWLSRFMQDPSRTNTFGPRE